MNRLSQLLALSLFLSFLCHCGHVNAQISWQSISKGIRYAHVELPQKSSHGDSKVHIVEVEPSAVNFQLLLATEKDNQKKTIDVWAREYDLAIAVNAGMFHGTNKDGVVDNWTNTGYTKNFKHLNNPKLNKDNALIVFNPINKDLPAFQIIDRNCQHSGALLKQYNSVIQNIRIIDCNKKVIWAQSKKKWSTAMLATTTEGKVLFIHCRSPYSVHDLMKQLLNLIPGINKAAYLEGGPESSLFVNAGTFRLSSFGSYETGFWENDKNDHFWALPNVIGVKSGKNANSGE